jgi:hypothetical protein
LDSEFIALSLVFILIGAAGIILFYGPMNATGDSCYCLIPSPEPGAAQGTSSIILALGILFLPMGLLKGGPPTIGKQGPERPIVSPSGKVYTPLAINSAKLFAFGIILVVIGVDVAVVPGYLVLRSVALVIGGAVIVALGLVCLYYGWKRPKAPQP